MEHLIQEKVKFMKRDGSLQIDKRTTWTPNDVIVYKDYAEMYLRNKKQKLVGITTIDIGDIQLIKSYKWHLTKRGYCSSQSKDKEIKLHRLLLNAKKGELVDHINGDKLFNRKCNLRIVTDSVSLKNRRHREIVPVIVSNFVQKNKCVINAKDL